MSEQYEIEYYEDEPSAVYCVACGQEMEWEDCWVAGCQDGWVDVYDEDPLWYNPGDEEICNECQGGGGWWACTNGDCPGKKDADV